MIRVTLFSWQDDPVGPQSHLYIDQYDLLRQGIVTIITLATESLVYLTWYMIIARFWSGTILGRFV